MIRVSARHPLVKQGRPQGWPSIIEGPVFLGSDNLIDLRFQHIVDDGGLHAVDWLSLDPAARLLIDLVPESSDVATNVLDTTALDGTAEVDRREGAGWLAFKLGGLAVTAGAYYVRMRVFETGVDAEPTVYLHEDDPLTIVKLQCQAGNP